MPVKNAVLFLIFNRPEQTEQVFNAIRQAKPNKLFVAADGPREGLNEESFCERARKITTDVDWPCTVHTLFRDKNLGCGKAVSSAITWFFENVEQGIILEDDCIPDQSFFEFCDELLDKYALNEKVMSISGNNLLPHGWKKEKQSYLFAQVGVWGWATWRRAWQLYDYEMSAWQNPVNQAKVRRAMKSNYWYRYYLGMFTGTYSKVIDTWDIQWVFCIFLNNAFPINPSVNLVKNIGFDGGGTHVFDPNSPFAKLEAHAIQFPLKHPAKIKIDKQYLRFSLRHLLYYRQDFVNTLKSRLRVAFEVLKMHLTNP